MGALTNEINTLKLYTSFDDEVWHIAGNGVPMSSGYSYDEFCDNPRLINKKSVVRLVGSARTAQLISKLYLAKQVGDIADLQVCSPQVETFNLDEYSPEKVLMNMRRWDYSPSVGGFHKVQTSDFLVYSIISIISNIDNYKDTSEQIQLLYKSHPMYKILSFVPFLNLEACAYLLAMIVDPRWYVDLNNPNKLANYFECLGVSSLKTPNEATGPHNPNFIFKKVDKRNTVLRAWRNDLNADKNLSSNFLANTYSDVRSTFAAKKIKGSELSFDEADLATSQKFLSFVYYMWLDMLYPMPNAWRESLFVPTYFFKRKEEVERFNSFFSK